MHSKLLIVFFIVAVVGLLSMVSFQDSGIDAQIVKKTKKIDSLPTKQVKQPVAKVVKKEPVKKARAAKEPAPIKTPFTIPSEPVMIRSEPIITPLTTSQPTTPQPFKECVDKYKVKGTLKCKGTCLVFTFDDAGIAKLKSMPVETTVKIDGDCSYCGIEYCNAQVNRMIEIGGACRNELTKVCYNTYKRNPGEDVIIKEDSIENLQVAFPDAQCIRCN